MNEIDLDKIDLTQSPPEHEPERQYYFMAKCREYVRAESKRLGRPLTCGAFTFGCQMNAKDSEKLSGILREIGYEEAATEEADFVLYNTCTVRENANTRVYGRIGYLGRLKRSRSPHMKIALCGCMMQEAHVVAKLQKSYPFVDLIFGTHNIYQLAELLFRQIYYGHMVVEIREEADAVVEELPSERKFSFKAGVNIMYGCNNFCSYCIVPYVRGRERSRRPEDILREMEEMAKSGVTEVMLLGQNVNSYGKTLKTPVSFAELLKLAEEVEGIRRIRFMTPHPKDLSDELIGVMAESKKICRHVHLPVQSGSSRILKLMNRHYTKEDYLALVARIRAAMPDVALTTDIIVGYPGETEEDFMETMDLVSRVRYVSAFTFLYSKRTGTPAAAIKDQVPEETAKERYDRLVGRIREISGEMAQADTGKTAEVLVEEVNAKRHGYVTGRLANNLLVHFPGDESLLGRYVDVSLTECMGFYYIGSQKG
ncbi:MAG: tRNA (N6-isopentenyl adenosine(37)-C2)-methylthiotransferase MiaB [Lachnospiraceae bacterium]|nr:tRNA (N6-isopentenyl adenosine(37)-C2)-methylthiotransferase MiaB [Lachnospiraceae bacterium]